jgi:hypothetical protein
VVRKNRRGEKASRVQNQRKLRNVKARQDNFVIQSITELQIKLLSNFQ